MSGQTLTDRIAAAQYSLTGSEVCRAVCKATTHEQTAPKKKHLEYLIQATQETNVNVPQMADTLIERAGNASWVVVFKALITTHHLMVHGNERFLQFLASRNTLFNLSNFLDRTGSHGLDMSTFIRRYSRYLNEKAFAYRQMSFDFGRVKKGAEGVMRTMSVEKLLKGMPTLQSQIDALLEFDVHPKDLNNGVINACFLLLFKDLIKLYACYNDGIINLLEKFFQMKRSQCKDGLEIYKRFLTRMTRVSEFFKIAEEVGIDKNDIPELTKAPESLLASLETHLNTLEGKKPEDKSPTKDATANNSMPAAAAPAAPAKPAPPAASGGPPARPVPPAKPPPPSVTPTAPVPTTASNALDDGFLLDLDPMSSSSAGGTAAASSTTGWGDLLATPAATDGASESLLAKKESAEANAAAAAAPVAAPPIAPARSTTAAAAQAPTSLPISAPASTTSATDIDLFGDAFAPSPGDGPAAVAAGPAADAFGGSDSFSSPASTPAAAPAPASVPAAGTSSPPEAEPEPVIDLLDSFGGPVEETQSPAPVGLEDDLLGGLMSPTLTPAAAPALAPALVQNDLLETGFDALGALPSPAPPVPAVVAAVPIVPAPATAAEPPSTTSAPSGGFDASMFDGLGDLLMPSVTPQSTGGSTTGSTTGSMGTPVAVGGIAAAPSATPPATKTIVGDLDTSLANLVGDLGVKKKDSQSEKKLTGGANWMPQVAPTSWATPGAPMTGATPGAPGVPGAAPPGAAMVPPMSAQPGFGMPPAAGPGAPMMQPMMGQPMMRPPFTGVAGVAPGAAAPGAPLSPGPASQSPKKPKDPLAELDLKDFL
ncbi:clathrin coat assembly protein AP180 isoform X8 [Neolamprologus brichardi]|uniref:clathrin coat assembly protein AP180 isoform X8 n=1 Tax=Neolamprologus brichardi TaxID=32507 RepID=UPI0003EC2588|nr:clathrin coat assembly protein AP180 isoform X8 [Neolamprologus brichardi]